MNGGAKPTFLMPAYDAQELRRRMAVGLTIGELYRLAEKLGVPSSPSWSGSPQDASRDIVRHFERSGALPFLVEALQEAKPFIEWPAPLPPPDASPFAAPPAADAAPPRAGAPGATSFEAPVSAAFDDAPTTVDPVPGDRPTPISTISSAAVFASSGSRSSPPAPAAGGFAPAVMPRPREASPALPASNPSAARAGGTEVDGDLAAFMAAGAAPPQPVIRDPALSPAAAWPGTVRVPDKPPQRTTSDYRLIAGGGAALLIVAVAIAFFVGRASSAAPGASAQAAPSGSSPPEPPGDQVALAKHVVGALGESLSRVARDCQIDLSTLRGRPLFAVAYHRCGPLPVQPSVPQQPSSYDPGPVFPSQNDVPDPPDPAAKARPSGNAKLQKVDTGGSAPAPGGSGCLSRCTRSHGACTSRCGDEPKQGSQYDAYQSCLSGCLKALSQCKLGCQ